MKIESKLASGHRTCAGCPVPLIVRTVLEATDSPIVASLATGCLEVATTIYPETSWNIPLIHSAFENAAATIAGAESAYKSLLKKKEKEAKVSKPSSFEEKLGYRLENNVKFIAFGGDGGTYDIGLQSLSGAMERGHDFLYICYNNEGYMNTGGQRSGSTSQGAGTSTTPSGRLSQGKIQSKKNLTEICVAHNIPYCAQASPFDLKDLENKVKKALKIKGPKFINVLSPCPTIWKFNPSKLMEISKLAVDTRFWPIYEVENGKYKINYIPSDFSPVEDFLKIQKRFSHLFKDPSGQKVIEEIQRKIDLDWERLKGK
jgi:pyruvate ferredoxin oxidoreductase beta subunit